MRTFLRGLLVGLWLAPWGAASVSPQDVAVLYNTAVPESGRLARLYCELRKVPEAQLIGLEMPTTADITREQFEDGIRKPLVKEYEDRGYWRLGRDSEGRVVPVACDKPVLLIMRGTPLRIKQSPKPDGFKPNPADPFAGRDEAAVDSELAVAGLAMRAGDVHPVGPLGNPFHNKEQPFRETGIPAMLLTCRIDAASAETCERMMRDAVATEATGLWGLAYIDFANKGREGEGYQIGEDWLDGVLRANLRAGIPTVIDRFADTLPKNYPMTRASLYYGWYDWNVSGPFLNPAFRFRPGAVAMHLHSFSAQQLADPNKNWSAPLLERGAAATIGNVFEPYLGPTHHFDILHARLLAGWTWVEAAWAAMPVTSWQGIALGDPLYRPFLRIDGGGKRAGADSDFIALRMAALKWGDDPAEQDKQLLAAAQRIKSGVLMEAVGLRAVADGRAAAGKVFFEQAKEFYKEPGDKMRQDFHRFAELRAASGGKEEAIKALRAARKRYGEIPERAAVDAWLDILDPPPPPPAQPPAAGQPAGGKKPAPPAKPARAR